jgi:hypothetical protein|tara:strand:+ start:225 stop:557 length:333 start_codon:yes stop_codon:yes gene_type:complete
MANQYKRYTSTLTSGASTTVLTVPGATTAIVKSVIITNNNGTASTIIMNLSPGGSGTSTIVPAKSISANDYEDLLTDKGPIILEAADELKFQPNASNVVALVSALLVDRN